MKSCNAYSFFYQPFTIRFFIWMWNPLWNRVDFTAIKCKTVVLFMWLHINTKTFNSIFVHVLIKFQLFLLVLMRFDAAHKQNASVRRALFLSIDARHFVAFLFASQNSCDFKSSLCCTVQWGVAFWSFKINQTISCSVCVCAVCATRQDIKRHDW